MSFKEWSMAWAKADAEKWFRRWMGSGYADLEAHRLWLAARDRWAAARLL